MQTFEILEFVLTSTDSTVAYNVDTYTVLQLKCFYFLKVLFIGKFNP
jgi:hypothetical protein